MTSTQGRELQAETPCLRIQSNSTLASDQHEAGLIYQVKEIGLQQFMTVMRMQNRWAPLATSNAEHSNHPERAPRITKRGLSPHEQQGPAPHHPE